MSRSVKHTMSNQEIGWKIEIESWPDKTEINISNNFDGLLHKIQLGCDVASMLAESIYKTMAEALELQAEDLRRELTDDAEQDQLLS